MTEWIEFKATCDSVLIEKIPEVQRLQYLKDALVGEPRSFVSHVLPTNGAFDRAMTLLKNRYQNTRAIVNEELRQWYAHPYIETPTVAVFRLMLNTINSLIASMASCDIATENWDALLIFHLVQRFDKITLGFWEEKPSKPFYHQKPSFENKRPNDRAKAFLTLKPDFECALCQKNHLPSRCDMIKNKPVAERIASLRRHRLCENCFYAHPVNECPFLPACLKCKESHHTLLHLNDQQTFFNSIENNEIENSELERVQTYQADPIEENDKHSTHSNEYSYHVSNASDESILLATAIVPTHTYENRSIPLKTVIDQGSTVNLISIRWQYPSRYRCWTSLIRNLINL